MMNMTPKAIWSWVAVIGLVLVSIGGILAFIPYVGLSLMALGGVMTIVAIIVLIPMLIKDMRKDDREMRSEITDEELRP